MGITFYDWLDPALPWLQSWLCNRRLTFNFDTAVAAETRGVSVKSLSKNSHKQSSDTGGDKNLFSLDRLER